MERTADRMSGSKKPEPMSLNELIARLDELRQASRHGGSVPVLGYDPDTFRELPYLKADLYGEAVEPHVLLVVTDTPG